MLGATRVILALIVTLVAFPSFAAEVPRFVAFSLEEAQKRLRQGDNGEQVRDLGGMTFPIGIVVDEDSDDWILVGVAESGLPPLSLDDFVVALRAVLLHGQCPYVSIEPTEDTSATGQYLVVYKGGIEGTALGRKMIEIDATFKRLALGKIQAEVWNVMSYSHLRVETVRHGAPNNLYSRFWIRNLQPTFAGSPARGVFAILDLPIALYTEVMQAGESNSSAQDSQTVTDEAGIRFAEQVTSALDELEMQYPTLREIGRILALASLGAGVEQMKGSERYKLWVSEYPVARRTTRHEYPLLSAEERVDSDSVLHLEGGIDSTPLAGRLVRGHVTALKQVVLGSRPSPDALSWHPPLRGWPIPCELAAAQSGNGAIATSTEKAGFAVASYLRRLDSPPLGNRLPFPASGYGFPPLPTTSIAPVFHDAGTEMPFSNRVGGVMLAGTARIEGAAKPEVSLADRAFSLVVDGKDARIDPKLFRKFVTALWCVYYSNQDPGISIDPIAPDVDKHLVRYIGRVINTDLGRVMREADYRMKKWAVGTERPNIKGFRDIDTWSYYQGNATLASRRFWFVPENLQFKRGGDLLLFDSGRMRVKTEFLADGLRGQAAPSDEKFARFFTEHYQEIAEKYPAYKELFEYAKLVALAKYLKQQGVPLHWFLMAHKDLVLTEDSPGTVDQLAKGSDYFRGVTIQGGVNLGAESHYRFDAEAVAAIQKALADRSAAGAAHAGSTHQNRPVSPVQPVSFHTTDRSYTVLPQHTASSGKDHHGNRYQTDLALRCDGKPGLELVRYFNPRQRDTGQFGRGWHLLIPYRVEPSDNQTRPFLNAVIPQRMVLENLLSGRREVLTFSPDRYAAAGYVPDKLKSSQVVGLFLMSNGSFRLADKLGNQFHFDPGGRMTDMFLSPSPEHHMHIEYADGFTAAFVEPPYRARPVDDERVDFLNVRVPKRIRVTDCIHSEDEVLTFDPNGPIPGYVPAGPETSRFNIVAILTNGGLELTDKHGNRIRLTPGWGFDSLHPSPKSQMVRAITTAGRRVRFGYTLDGQGRVVIATAAVAEDESDTGATAIVRYRYDVDGRLCRVERPTPLATASAGRLRQGLALASNSQGGKVGPSPE